MNLPIESVLASRPDPLGVLRSTAYVVEHARSVRLNAPAVARAADALVERQVEPPAWDYTHHYFDGTPRSVNYFFMLDALNFCFWGQPRWRIEYGEATLDGYWALAAALKQSIDRDPSVATAEFLAAISPEALERILHGAGQIPLFVERWRHLRELGTVLRNLWEGQAARLVECADHDAARLAQLVVENLASFNDITIYDGREVRLFKRAQILVTDLWGAFGGRDWGEFDNIEVLTAFADYKLPQILRAWGVMRYSTPLANKVDGKIPLAAGSSDEIEIRAATLWAVELLRMALAERGRPLWSVQIDWILWDASQGKFKGIKPYHHTRTVYY